MVLLGHQHAKTGVDEGAKEGANCEAHQKAQAKCPPKHPAQRKAQTGPGRIRHWGDYIINFTILLNSIWMILTELVFT